MRLYVVQHGEAKLKEEDRDRPLTQRGISDVRRVEAFLKPLGLRVRAIWHSGKTRAAETAEMLAKGVEAAEGLVSRNDMAPDDDIGPLRREIEQFEEDLMLVGHMPFLGRLAGKLLADDQEAQLIAFQKGGVACLDWGEDGFWRVAWMLTPEVL